MEIELLIVPLTILFGCGVSFLFLAFLTRPQYKKNQIMTEGEYRYFKSLEQSVSLLYTICPQVRLANIVGLKGLFLWHHFRPLGGKCVDFVLLDKKTGETVLIIELDDRSHQMLDRKRRDFFVDYVLTNAGIPILHERYQQTYDSNRLAERIQAAIQ